MTIIHRTVNGWLLTDNDRSIGTCLIDTPFEKVHTFHSNQGLMSHLRDLFDDKQNRNAKGQFQKKQPNE